MYNYTIKCPCGNDDVNGFNGFAHCHYPEGITVKFVNRPHAVAYCNKCKKDFLITIRVIDTFESEYNDKAIESEYWRLEREESGRWQE